VDPEVERMAIHAQEAWSKHTIFTWEADGVWNTHENYVRGNTFGRACDCSVLEASNAKPIHGRVYKDEELWTNMR